MKNMYKNLALFICLLMNVAVIAQPNPDDPNDPNPTDAPIDNYILLLAILGIALCYYQFKKDLKET